MNNDWLELIKRAVGEAIDQTGAAVPGAKLRQKVAKIAASQGLEFPPSDMGKFSSFLEKYPSEFVVLRRPGQDILVAPTDRADLFADEFNYPGAPGVRIRQDLFDALIRLPSAAGVAVYLPDSDSVFWMKDGESSPANAIPLPMTSMDEELALRGKFAGAQDVGPEAISTLTESLTQNAPLREFSEAVHAFGLVKEWHIYRLNYLAHKLKGWSIHNAVTWQSSWINTAAPKTVSATAYSAPMNRIDTNAGIIELAHYLTDEDIARITIPLDIVLRLLANPNK